jgi:hypothetical protein
MYAIFLEQDNRNDGTPKSYSYKMNRGKSFGLSDWEGQEQLARVLVQVSSAASGVCSNGAQVYVEPPGDRRVKQANKTGSTQAC